MPLRALVALACAGLFVSCAASLPPAELIEARLAYQHASASLAAEFVPAELAHAREALATAEWSFHDDPASTRTRDLADVAERKARLAEVLATSAARKAVTTTAAKSDSQATLDGIKTRNLIAGARRRAAAKVEQNSLPQSKESASTTKKKGPTHKQPMPKSRQYAAVESTPGIKKQRLDPRTNNPGSMRTARILLVSDDRDRRDSVRRILKSTDYQIVEAADCENAIDLIGNAMFDVILLGFALPDESSIRVLASLKQYQLTTRVIVISEGPGLESAVKSATLAARAIFPGTMMKAGSLAVPATVGLLS